MTTQPPYTDNNSPEASGELLPLRQNQLPPQPGIPEQQPMSSELPTAGQVPPQPQPMHQGQGAQPQMAVPQPAPVSSGVSHSAPAVADDVDLIEKEWVHRAKALVAKTKDNPHVQNKEMNKFKADYIKKRYNKEIKVSEG